MYVCPSNPRIHICNYDIIDVSVGQNRKVNEFIRSPSQKYLNLKSLSNQTISKTKSRHHHIDQAHMILSLRQNHSQQKQEEEREIIQQLIKSFTG